MKQLGTTRLKKYWILCRATVGDTTQEAPRESDEEEINYQRILIKLVSARHDDEDINVAARVWLSIGMRAEQDNLARLETFDDLTGELPHD